jgi:uncharacterized lipoprotein YmbA
MLKGMAMFLLITVCAACSMPETQIYSLHMSASNKSLNKNTNASIAILMHSPKYLTQPYIAYRKSPYQLLISRYSKWESSPEEMVSQAMRDALSATGSFKETRTSYVVPAGFYSLTIHLKRFERMDEGDDSFGELSFEANLRSPDGRDVYHGSVSKRTKLEDRSFASLAKGLSTSLAEGITEIRGSVQRSLRQ